MQRLMFVDDEEYVLAAMKRMCRGNKEWDVEYYTDPREALKRAQTTTFALILSDYRMPVLNGVQFLGEMKVLQPNSIRLILSGQTDRAGLIAAINEAEVFRFIDKPWEEEGLLTDLQQALQFYDIREENRRLVDQVRNQQQELLQRKQALDSYKTRHPDLFKVEWAADGSIILGIDNGQNECG